MKSFRSPHQNVHKTQLRFEKYVWESDNQELISDNQVAFVFAVTDLVADSIRNAVMEPNVTEEQQMVLFLKMIQLLLNHFGFKINYESKDSDARIQCNGKDILDIEWNCFEKLLPGGKNDNTSVLTSDFVLPETVVSGVRNKASMLCDVGLLISTSRLVCIGDDDLKKGAEYLKKTVLKMDDSDDKKQKTK